MSMTFSLWSIAPHLMRATFSNESRVTPCVTYAIFSSHENFCIQGNILNSEGALSMKYQHIFNKESRPS